MTKSKPQIRDTRGYGNPAAQFTVVWHDANGERHSKGFPTKADAENFRASLAA
jgi:hypothetical protein